MTKKIKSVTLFKYDLINPNNSHPKGQKHSYTELDEKGNLLLEIKYDDAEEVEEKYVYAFDDQNKLVEEISYLSENEIAEHKTYEYNPEGLLIKAFKHYADGSKDIIQYQYDQEGRPEAITTTDSDNETEAKEVLEWEKKNLINKEVYEFDELVLKEIKTYDEQGNRTEELKWTPEDGNTRMEYYFNQKNDLIKSLTYNNEDKLISKILYTYDDKGKMLLADYESVRSKNTTTIVYDENGNAIEQTETNAAGEINNRAIRKYNDRNEVIETSVIIDLHGSGINQEYILNYEYEYFGE